MNLFKVEYILHITDSNKFYSTNRTWRDNNNNVGVIIKAENCVTHINDIMFIDVIKFNTALDEVKGQKKNIKTKLISLNAKTVIFYGSKEELDIYIEDALVTLNIIVLTVNEYMIKKLLE